MGPRQISMSPERYQRISKLVEDALERPEGEQVPFLQEACANDSELLAASMQWLDAYRRAPSFLDRPIHFPDEIATFLASADSLRQLHSIGKYRLDEVLGEGGMGVVFRGFDPTLGRPVAIKIIHARVLAKAEKIPRLRERFDQEARSLGSLSHGNIVAVHEFDEQEGRQYLVMEYVEGRSLEDLLRGAQLEREEVISILRQVAGALDYAHRKGVIHRDVKPANILVQPDGKVKLTDFGIAKIVGQAITQATSLGTFDYVAPEQVRAFKDVTAAADQYSLAVVAYRMLYGRLPGEASAHAHFQNTPLPFPTYEVLKKGLAEGPGARFSTCTEFVESLAKSLSVSPEAGHDRAQLHGVAPRRGNYLGPTGEGHKRSWRRWSRRRPERKTVVYFVVSLTVVLVAGTFAFYQATGVQSPKSAHSFSQARSPTTPNVVPTFASSPPPGSPAEGSAPSLAGTSTGGPTVLQAVIQNGTSLQLLPGRMYLYGMTTGGGKPATGFALGQFAQAINRAGQLSAALAYGTNDRNEYTTQTEYQAICGVSVGGAWDRFAAYRGLNEERGTGHASVTFSTSGESLVVVIALGSSQQAIQLEGIAGLQTDRVGDEPAVMIAHAYLSQGTYTVRETTRATAAGQTPEHMADLIGAFVFKAAAETERRVIATGTDTPLESSGSVFKLAVPGQILLSDNFSRDARLNGTLWTTATPLLKGLGHKSEAAWVDPRVAFSAAGMQMSGVTGTYQFTGLQLTESFSPPFSAQVTVMGAVANGNAFVFDVVSDDLSQYITLQGNLNPKNGPYCGINLNSTDPATPSARLYSSPSVNVWYVISISVDAKGKANVMLATANGMALGSRNGINLGTGGFYVVLAQQEGLPYPGSRGPEIAVWQRIQVSR